MPRERGSMLGAWTEYPIPMLHQPAAPIDPTLRWLDLTHKPLCKDAAVTAMTCGESAQYDSDNIEQRQ